MHLFLPNSKNAAPPFEYLEVQLCRDVYHCRASELEDEDWETIERHLVVLEVEAKHRNEKQKKANARNKRRPRRR